MESKQFPTLFHKSRTGAIHSWQVETDKDIIISTHGQVDGQKIVSKKVATPKNTGRSNETTGIQQALIEAAAMHKFKVTRKYSLTPDEAKEEVLLPMLAHPWEKYEKKVKYPIHVQPKLDGVRAIARWEGDKVVLISRSGKPWLATAHLNEQLEEHLQKGAVVDGEIYLHGKGFQWITARSKKKQPGTELLEYHIYDMPEIGEDSRDCFPDPHDECPWEYRRDGLSVMADETPSWSHIHYVWDEMALDKADVVRHHDAFVADGYEGLIARTHDGLYEYGHRSPSLLKVKAFQDAEYAIVGHTDGLGVEKGLVIWTCSDPVSKKTFDTRPRGTHDDRRQLFNEAESHYGEMLKVRFFGFTEDGLPRFPIGIGIRVEEDM
jgi:DNA ligase-1